MRVRFSPAAQKVLNSKKPKIIVVLGPTATGKSDLAVYLASKFNGEVISADSRQVYKKLDIGSGKITVKEMLGVRHHMLDIISPKKVFTAADYSRLAERAIKDILSREKLPIICGGTGFYIDMLVGKISVPEVPPNPKLREILKTKSLQELEAKLKKLDPKRARDIDLKNKVRLIRAIEIATSLGNIPKIKNKDSYDLLWIGLDTEKELLSERIKKRLDKRLKSGMIEEVQKLHIEGGTWKRLEELGLEYRYIARFLQGKLTKEQMSKDLLKEIVNYSKRQRTWFKRNKSISWFDCRSSTHKEKAALYVKNFLNLR